MRYWCSIFSIVIFDDVCVWIREEYMSGVLMRDGRGGVEKSVVGNYFI